VIGLRHLPPLARRAGIAGALALLACVVLAFVDRAAFFQAWLVTWLFLLGIALASMADVMIHELTGGAWGLALRPPLEAAMATLPLLALFALPLALGLPDLFPWARAGDTASDAKRWFLNAPSFLLRNAVWLVLWSAFALAMRRQLATGTAATPAGRRIAVAGLLVYLFTVTVAAIDWVASLVPAWYSTAIGVRLGTSQFVAAFGFAVPFAVLRGRAAAVRPRDFQDLGNLLLTFSMTWAYIAFTQYLIVWGEDLPHETSWFVPRALTSWQPLAVVLVALVFAVPTIAMLFRAIKRSAKGLAVVCAIALAGCWLDAFWLVAPSVRPQGFELHAVDLLALVAQGGLWLAAVAVLVERVPARPLPSSESTVHD
jgi:hypothetical protein